jgi:hypothetical protein
VPFLSYRAARLPSQSQLDRQSTAPISAAAKIPDRRLRVADFKPDDGMGGGPTAERPVSVFKVFSATKAHDREELGDRVGAWLAANPHLEIRKTVVNLSSDSKFHCLSLVLICSTRQVAG